MVVLLNLVTLGFFYWRCTLSDVISGANKLSVYRLNISVNFPYGMLSTSRCALTGVLSGAKHLAVYKPYISVTRRQCDCMLPHVGYMFLYVAPANLQASMNVIFYWSIWSYAGDFIFGLYHTGHCKFATFRGWYGKVLIPYHPVLVAWHVIVHRFGVVDLMVSVSPLWSSQGRVAGDFQHPGVLWLVVWTSHI